MRLADSARFEIKQVTEETNLSEVRSWLHLHPAVFTAAYPPRWVNNIYFDTPHLRSLEDNFSGRPIRQKVRLRWYGQNLKRVRGSFEMKIRRNMWGWKLTEPLATDLDLEGWSWGEFVAALRVQLSDDLRAYLDDAGEPVVINRYQREYYRSFDGSVRVTLDYGQEVYDQRCSASPNLTRRTPSDRALIVEFKASVADREKLAEAAAYLPLRVGRCSKYVRGVETLLGC